MSPSIHQAMKFVRPTRQLVTATGLLLLLLLPSFCFGEDWPMWRFDAGRTGATPETPPENLSLQWERQLPVVEPAFHSSRLQFDAGYEPVAADGLLLVASSRHDSVTAFDAATGELIWTFRTNGPVRFAPAISKESVCFGSDDGYLYCVALKTGELIWRHQSTPSSRQLLGNRRLISVWPVRGGPVTSEGTVYFAAGVWPFEGVFVVALEIETGKLIWRNEEMGHMYGTQPHNTKAMGGLAPQGYLVVNGEELIVPCSTAYPARLNRKTGELIEFELPAPGRVPGGWFAAVDSKTAQDIRRGKISYDAVVNSQRHEDTVRKGAGEDGVSRLIRAGDRTMNFEDKFAGVEGAVHSIIVSDQKVFVSTREGKLFCFAAAEGDQKTTVKTWPLETTALETTETAISEAKRLTEAADSNHGVALVLGLTDGSLVKALVKNSQMQVIAFDNDAARVAKLRDELQQANVAGERAAVIETDLTQLDLPAYLATIITSEASERLPPANNSIMQALRPFGGIAALGDKWNEAIELKTLTTGRFEKTRENETALIRRVGPLPGSTDYRGEYSFSEDELVRAPLGVLWFDDTLAHFKRSPQPQFFDGVMVSRPKDWTAKRVRGDYSVDYPLQRPVLSDIYTGRVLDASEQSSLRGRLPELGLTKPQPSYYHAPHQKTALSPLPPVFGERVNPITGQTEKRSFPKTYGCDGGVDYGSFYTLRSGTGAFYDKTLESGAIFISGPRSGCTNSIIPSGGLLNVPYFYEGCTCSYPLPTALSMVSMPETFEQWAAWGDDTVAENSIERIGINFGAPGDRMTRDGTLWLDYPSKGGPSPKIRVETEPADPQYDYHHSLWMHAGEGWPWVAASTVSGLKSFTLHDVKPGRYKVRLYFAETQQTKPTERVQTIAINGKTLLRDFDIAAESKHAMTGIVREFSDVIIDDGFTISLSAKYGMTLISGLELIREK